MKKSILLFFGVIFLQWLSFNAVAAEIAHSVLANGMEVFVREDHRSPVVISQIWYKVGSRLEPDGITGVSHALEHMMFKGTKKFPGNRFSRIVMEVGGQNNAATSNDYTYYYELFNTKELALAFQLEADRMQNLIIPADEFKKEIEVVKEERLMRIDSDPKGKAYEQFKAVAFLSSPYRHPTIGWRYELDAMQVSDLRQWYHRYYTPSNAVLVVVGDVQAHKVFALAKKYFAGIPAKAVPLAKPQEEVTALGERRMLMHTGVHVPWLLMSFNVPSMKTARQAWEPFALILLAEILDGDASARLEKKLVRGRNMAVETQIAYDMFSALDDLFTISATPARKHSALALEQAIFQEIASIQQHGVTLAELNRAKTSVYASQTYHDDSLTNQATWIGQLAVVGLPVESNAAFLKKINAITPKQIQDVAKRYLVRAHATIAHVLPKPGVAARTEATNPALSTVIS